MNLTIYLSRICYALICPYLTYGCTLRGNKYEASISQVVKLQNKAVRIINNVPLRAHITSHYANLGLIKFPDIVKLKTCQLFYDLIVDNKPSNLTLSFVSEQHNYTTRRTSLQYLNPSSFRTNIRTFCPTIIGCYYWNDIPLFIRSMSNKLLLILKDLFLRNILLSTNYCTYCLLSLNYVFLVSFAFFFCLL